MIKRRAIIGSIGILPALLAILLFSSCTSYEGYAQKRAEKARIAKGDILIAIVWNAALEGDLFNEGISMAVDEINKGGGPLGRKLKIVTYNDQGSVSTGLSIAKKIAANTDIVAVIGHATSTVAIPVSAVYEKGGLIFISPGSTAPNLTNHNFQNVFRNIPSDAQTGKQLAEFAYNIGFRKMAVIDDSSEYGSVLADIFHERAVKLGIEIKVSKRYYPWQTDFKPLIDDIKQAGVEALFLGGDVPLAAELIKQSRDMGVTVPFIGGDGLDAPSLWEIAGKAADGTIVSTVFDNQLPDPVIQRFNRDFYSRFKMYPTTWAAQGYDAVKILSAAFQAAGTTEPIVVSSYLRYIVDWHGVTGAYSFTENGDITGKRLYFKVLDNGRFNYLEYSDDGPPGQD